MLGLVAKEAIGKYKSLKPDEKQKTDIVLLLGVGLTLFTGYRLVSKLDNMFSFGKSEEQRLIVENDLKKALSSELAQKIEPTLKIREAKAIANNLWQAFLNYQGEVSINWYDGGTDEASVFHSLSRLKNESDFLLVSKYFGAPRSRSLASELHYELTNSEMKNARSILLKINVKI